MAENWWRDKFLTELQPFRNEPYTDFSIPANRQAMKAALAKVRPQLGQEYKLLIAGERVATGDFLKSVNPAKPGEVVGSHHKATADQARHAVESAFAYFEEWRHTPVADRIQMALRAAAIIRERKLEFDAWLSLECGKTWPEAEAEVAEAIDFLEYYARQMARFAHPEPVVQLPGETDRMEYIPLGVGIIIPPWNFALAILAGMA